MNYSLVYEKTNIEEKSILIIPHLGMGDMININGMVRFLSQKHPHIFLLCANSNFANVQMMLEDVKNVHLLGVESGDDNMTVFRTMIAGDILNDTQLTDVFRFGYWGGYDIRSDMSPECFYNQMNIDPKVKTDFFTLPLIEQLRVPDEPYIFVQTVSSNSTHNGFITWDKNSVLTIDSNKNLYEKGHKWFGLAEQYINKPIFCYCELLKNASQLHLLNSSFQCLSACLNRELKAEIRKCYARETGEVDEHFTRQLND